MTRILLDPPIRDLHSDPEFMQKAEHALREHYGEQRRFRWQQQTFKFVYQGQGRWLLYREEA